MKYGERAPLPWSAALATTAVAVVSIGLAVPGHASLSAPPDGSTTTTTLALMFEDGMFTSPDGSLSAAFSSVPTKVLDADNNVVSYLLGVDEDTQSVVVFTPNAFGANPESTASERADLFLGASGTDIELLANSETRLGPFPAAHFIARLTLGDDRQAVVYGIVVVRDQDVVYAFYTDAGGDDNAPATAFVESFAVVLSPPPVPTTSTTTSTIPSSAPSESTEGTATAPASSDPLAMTTTTTSPPIPPSTVAAAPPGATLGYDGRWWVTFPDDALPAFRASTERGYAYAEYLAVDGDDTLIVRVTEVPAGFEWTAATVADAEAARVGGTVQNSDTTDVGGHEAVRFTVAQDDSGTSGDITQMLVVNGGDRVYRVMYEDAGTTSKDDADDFIESFELA